MNCGRRRKFTRISPSNFALLQLRNLQLLELWNLGTRLTGGLFIFSSSSPASPHCWAVSGVINSMLVSVTERPGRLASAKPDRRHPDAP